jgi:hypothetical protein
MDDTEGSDDHYQPTDAINISDTRSSTPDTEIVVGDQGGENLLFGNNLRSRLNAGRDEDGENNESRNDLRSRLDDDEQFLDSPELYQEVANVAKRYGCLPRSYFLSFAAIPFSITLLTDLAPGTGFLIT